MSCKSYVDFVTMNENLHHRHILFFLSAESILFQIPTIQQPIQPLTRLSYRGHFTVNSFTVCSLLNNFHTNKILFH